MRLFILLATIFFSTVMFGQYATEQNSNKQKFNFYFKQRYTIKRESVFKGELKLQEAAFLFYKRRRLNCFVLAENILNEIFKPVPAINKEGFYYRANPFIEIEETKGNTGFIKWGMMINLVFK